MLVYLSGGGKIEVLEITIFLIMSIEKPYQPNNRKVEKVEESSEPTLEQKLSRLDTAIASSDKVRLENHMRYIQGNLERIHGASDWQKIDSQISGFKRSDEEMSAIEDTLHILKSFSALEDKQSVLKRATRKLTEIAIAHKSFKGSLEEPMTSVETAIKYLFDAVGEMSSPEALKEALHIVNGTSEEGNQEMKDRAMNMKVSGG